jgi:U3 small nucleolar RNA-associated protein 13
MTDSAAYRRRNKLKTAFKVCRDVRPIYSGGKVVLSTDGLHLYSCLDDVVVGTHTATGEELCRIEGDSSVTSLALTPFSSAENAHLLIARRSFGLHFCSVPDGQEYKLVARAHDAPIITTSADPTGSLFATGSSDGIIKVWDARAGHCTHVFKGHGGVISAFAWDLSSRAQPRLISAADDCRIWSLTDRKCLDVLEGHSSVVRGLAVTEDGRTLVSGGRDRLVNVWSIAAGSPSKLKAAISVSETLESCGLVKGKGKAKQQSVYTGGDRGHIRLWSLETGKATAEASTSQLKAPEITDVMFVYCT